MRFMLFRGFFLIGGCLLYLTNTVYAQTNLTQRLLDFTGPLKPVPKPSLPSTGEITDKDLLTYHKIFALQKEEKWESADLLIETLEDKRLLGYILRDRYLHPTGYTSSYKELKSWMDSYADHAGADRIYKLAKRKGGAGSVKRPKEVQTVHRYIDITSDSKSLYGRGEYRSDNQKSAFQSLAKRIREKTRNERPTQALEILNSNRQRLTTLDYNRLKSRIAASYMHEGKISRAQVLAKEAVERAGQKVPLGAWVAGLSSWRKNDFESAAKFFEVAASSQYANAWTRSGGAFWASRSHMRMGNFRAVSLWLNRAASEPRTFYGLIATRALSRKLDFDWEIGAPSYNQKVILARTDAGVRGLALLRLKRYNDAEHEFRFVEKTEALDVRRAIIPVAEAIGSPGIAWRGASYLIYRNQDNVPLAAQYPIMRWQYPGPYQVDKALLHAVIRQESKFNPKAGNPSGASGLMQLLPSTARGVMGSRTYDNAGGQQALYNPEFNLRAGQKYVHELFKTHVPNRNLFDLLIAWNAGPGNLKRWRRNLKSINDPLLFIETIPVAETRAFVERVMTNYWMYQDRFGRPTPSLDAVAEGKWPIYFGR